MHSNQLFISLNSFLSWLKPDKGLAFLPHLISLLFNASEYQYCQEKKLIGSTYLSMASVFSLPHTCLLVGSSTSGSSSG